MTASQATQHQAPAQSVRIYERLRQDVIDGHFKPGEKLPLEKIRQLYGVGNTPLREALSKLAANGLIVQQNQRGFRVPPVSKAELEDICQTRIHIEVEALGRAIRKGDAQWEADVLAAHHRLVKTERAHNSKSPEWEARHDAFHESLISACGSPWMLNFCHALYDQFNRYRRLAQSDRARREELDAQHKTIMALAILRREREARDLLADHIWKSAGAALSAVAE